MSAASPEIQRKPPVVLPDVGRAIDSVDLPIVVVDCDISLALFNAAAAQVLCLSQTDIGRPLRQIAVLARFTAELHELCERVVTGAPVLERRVRIANGSWFLVRIVPYSHGDGQTRGAVITFANVTALHAVLEQAVDEREYTKTILNTVGTPLLVLDAGLNVQTANRAFFALFRMSREQVLGASLGDLGQGQWRVEGLHELLVKALSGQEFDGFEMETEFSGVGRKSLSLSARRLSREPAEGPALLLTLEDVTARKQTESELKQSEERYRRLMSLLPAAVYTCDAAGTITFYNAHATRLWGRAPEIGAPDERFCGSFRLWLPDGRHLPHADTPMALAVSEGREFRNQEVVIERPDGSRITVLVNIDPLRDDRGQLVGAINVFHDTTALKEAEQALRKRTAQFETLLNQAPLGVYLVDADFRIKEVNPVARPVFASIPDLIGRDLDEVIHILWPKEYADEVVQRFRHTLQTGEPYATPEHIEKRLDSGVLEYYEWRIDRIPLPEGRYGVVCYFRDISRQVLARAALAESEERLRLMAESMPQKIFTARPDGEVDYLNPQWMEFSGLPLEQIKGWGWTQLVHSDDVEHNVLAWKHALKTGQAFEFEQRFRRADGQYRWHISRALPMRADNGGIVMWIGSNSDIHEIKEAQQALQEADRRKNEFLALLGHELRNPLAPIRTASELLSRTLADNTHARTAIEMIKRQAGQLTRLVDDLLDVGRITQGRIELQRRPLEVASVITQALETVESELRQKRHQVSVIGGYEPLYVNGDPARLVQCVVNVLTNAAKYTDAQGQIRVETRAQGSNLVIEISDNGTGIAPDLLPRIFDLFVQGDRTLDRAQGGLGIGLSVVKRLIEMHDGEVSAQSAGLGQGSTITIRLPRIERPEEPRAQPTEVKATPRRVLIVDDNADAANSLAMLLGFAGHSTRVACSGLQALECVESFRPDVALLDIGLPGMSGYELAQQLRGLEKLKGIRLVALTGYGQLEDRQRAQAAGFDDHLVKPADLSALEQALA